MPKEKDRRIKTKTSHPSKIARKNKQFYQTMISTKKDTVMIEGKLYKAPTHCKEYKGIFQRLMEVMQEAIVLVDFDGNIVFANLNFTRMIGQTYQNLLMTRFERYIDEQDQDKVIEVFARLSSGQTAMSIPAQLKTVDGRLLSVIISSSPIYYQRKYQGILMVISDITQIYEAKARAELLAGLVEGAQYDMMFIVQLEGFIMECNSLARQVFGFGQRQMSSLNIRSFFQSGADEIWRKVLSSIKKKGRWKGEITAVSMAGKKFPVEITISKTIGPAKMSAALICFMRDITERKQTEKEIKASLLARVS